MERGREGRGEGQGHPFSRLMLLNERKLLGFSPICLWLWPWWSLFVRSRLCTDFPLAPFFKGNISTYPSLPFHGSFRFPFTRYSRYLLG